jgi:hypothetical protein
MIITFEQLLDVVADVLSGGEPERDTICAINMIRDWTNETMARKPGQEMLCLDCDTAFNSATPPAAFLVVLPVFEGNVGSVSGICLHCMQGDLEEKVIRRLRMMVTNFELKPFGHA